MKQTFKKFISAVVATAIMLSLCVPGFAQSIADGTNGNTIYLSFKFSSDAKGNNEISTCNAEDNFFIFVNFAGNPTVLKDSIQAYDLLVKYNSDKISFIETNKKAENELLTAPTTNPTFNSETAAAAWASTDGIVEENDDGDYVPVVSGTLFRIKAQAKTALTPDDLKQISIVKEASSATQNKTTSISDGNQKTFTVIFAPSVSVGTVLGDIYSDSTAEEIKNCISSFTFVDANGKETKYTSNDTAEWSKLSVTLPENGLVVGKNTLTASYDGYTCEFTATVLDKVSSIAVTTAPTKTVYTAFEKFDKTGMVVTATYESGKTENVTSSCTVDTTTALKVSDTSITVTYGGKTATQAITVNPYKVTKPEASEETLTYNANTQNFGYKTAVDASYVTVSGATSGKDAGTYNATAALKDKANTTWADGTSADVSLSWTIGKADVVSGMAAFSATYSTTYAQLVQNAELTGINGEKATAAIKVY